MKLTRRNLFLVHLVLLSFISGCDKQRAYSALGQLRNENRSSCPVAAKKDFIPQVIYGTDDRIDYFEIQNAMTKKIARSTVAIVEEKNLTDNSDGRTYFSGKKTLQERENMCPTERFASQPTFVYCSAALVGKDLVLTAGHCFNSPWHITNIRFVFDFRMNSSSDDPSFVPTKNTYKAKEIVSAIWNQDVDYSVVRLDRPVEDRPPLRIRRSGQITDTEKVFAMGHPLGLPLKLAGNAFIRDNTKTNYFVTNLDVYIHNSGSPVFNQETGYIEGMVVRGNPDFKTVGSCKVSGQCKDNECRGQDISRVSQALAYIPDVPDLTEDPPSAGDSCQP